jgi:biopolymer transport protein ExbD
MPLMNVLFLVLVFYVMGSKFVLNPGVQVSLPATMFAIGPQRNTEIVSITAGPVSIIYHRDRAVTLEDFSQRLSGNSAAEKSLIIKADRNAPSGIVAAVTNEALRHSYTVILAGDIPKQ